MFPLPRPRRPDRRLNTSLPVKRHRYRYCTVPVGDALNRACKKSFLLSVFCLTLGVDRPFNHTTKVGSVKERTGDYEDALRNKKALVIPMILEAFGGEATVQGRTWN